MGRSSRMLKVMILGVVVLVLLGFFAGLTYFLWRPSSPPPPPPSPAEPFDQPNTASEPLVSSSREQAVSIPKSSETESSPAKVISPIDGKLTINIYQDFIFQPTGWPLGLSVGQTTAGGLETLPYEHLVREPEYRSEKVLYGYLPLGNGDDRQISFVLDDTDQPNWVVYVDANNNEDLTDDGPPHPNEGTGKMAATLTVQVEIVMSPEEQMFLPYTLWLWFIESQGEPYFYAHCHYAGKLELDGVIYEAVAFERFRHDGLFRESGLWIDLNQDKKLDEETEHFEDKDAIRVNNMQYQLELQYP